MDRKELSVVPLVFRGRGDYFFNLEKRYSRVWNIPPSNTAAICNLECSFEDAYLYYCGFIPVEIYLAPLFDCCVRSKHQTLYKRVQSVLRPQPNADAHCQR